MGHVRRAWVVAVAGVLVARVAGAQVPPEQPAQPDETELSREVENPIGRLRSIPVQDLTEFGIGPNGLARNTIAIQPILTWSPSEDVSFVSRTRVPIVSTPDLTMRGGGYTSGLGDMTESLFLVPRSPPGVLWGLGPTFLLPTATANQLGSGQLGVGPSAAVLTQPRPLTLGVLVGQMWSIAGASNRPDISQLAIMYFAALHFPRGWYLNTMPIVTANWNAASPRNVWTVPVGGGGGKVFRAGGVPLNVSVGAYWNAIRPDTVAAPSGSAQVQVALLLP